MSKLYKIKVINIFIIIIWIILFMIGWISYTRFMYFLLILEIILIYRIIINKLEKSKILQFNNKKILKFIIIINKWRNPLLLLLIKLDVLMYDIIIYYNNKLLNIIIYMLYILIINPLKIFYFKFYKILWIWKTNKIWNILFNRMFGLILSVLIFTNLIGYIKNTLHISLILIIYLYFLIISVLCELIESRENKWLKIFLVNHITTKSVVSNKLGVNLLSIVLKKNNIDELTYYFNKNIEDQVNLLQVGYLWYIINSLKNFEYKPSYDLYIKLWYILDLYLTTRMDTYIFFEYYKWDILNIKNINLIEINNKNDIFLFIKMYKYDYEVFKLILFLYWDLEYYMEGIDYVKNSLIVDSSDIEFIRVKLNNELISNLSYLNKIKYKEPYLFPYMFSTKIAYDPLNIEKLIIEVDKYDLYTKCNNDKYINDIVISLYKKINNVISDDEVSLLRELQSVDDPMNSSYYQNYIDEWYKEWYNGINKSSWKKYFDKIKKLELEYLHFKGAKIIKI